MQEQLESGHIAPSNSPWNSPIFVIKKKSGKWRLLQDLRRVNETMELMGALQPGLPSPMATPRFPLPHEVRACIAHDQMWPCADPDHASGEGPAPLRAVLLFSEALHFLIAGTLGCYMS